MPKHKKKFIDKKNAVTFHLVHRSQKDPLITDESAPQHVLVEGNKQPGKEASDEREKRKAEERKFGIFYDDDYDYMQHLRNREDPDAIYWEYIPPANLNKNENEPSPSDKLQKSKSTTNKISLPSSVFASEFEEDEGLLNKAAPYSGPRLDLNFEVLNAMEDDFDYENPENQLEDDFMEKAMGGDGDEDEENDYDSDSDENDFGDEEKDGLGPLRNEHRFDNEETKSRFTEYSMSSSVIRRNEQLSLLDDRFEKFYENYDEPEIGALDCEEIEGHIEFDDNLLSQCMDEMKRPTNEIEYDRKWDEKRVKKIMEEESSEEEMVDVEVNVDDNEKKWDCESILSIYSNKYNHPKLISEPIRRKSKIVINPKTGLPENVFNGENIQLTQKSLNKFNAEIVNGSSKTGPKSLCDQSVLSTLSVLSIRPKDETNVEKKQRKRLIKDYRNERRIERKANTEAFKDEKKRQTQIKINNQNNIQGNRIL